VACAAPRNGPLITIGFAVPLVGTRQDPSRSALPGAQVLEVRAPTIIIGGLGDKPGGVVMGVEQLVDDLS